jgi:hypothetical protein
MQMSTEVINGSAVMITAWLLKLSDYISLCCFLVMLLLHCVHPWTFGNLVCPGREFPCLRCDMDVQSIGVLLINIMSQILVVRHIMT